ncbi:hypothetical protein V5P93_000867 [Actinokineospora auranticolor]|nr:hypothetical protein [Actinokineospora auranticolor]
MAKFDDRLINGNQGAVLYLSRPANKTLSIRNATGTIEASSGSAALVVNLASYEKNLDELLQAAVALAQQALDRWAIHGNMSRVLDPSEDRHILWWSDSSVGRSCRMHTSYGLTMTLSAEAQVQDSNGNIRPSLPPSPPAWHLSFRYFRLAQSTTDMVDAFRNYYLALEAILSTIEPPPLRADGRPAGKEKDWLDAAFRAAAKLVNFADYAPPNTPNPDKFVRSDIYANARTLTFHAKAGALVMLPHEHQTRQRLRTSVKRLRQLYLDLTQASLGFRHIGGGGLTTSGFEMLASTYEGHAHLYVSSQPVQERRPGEPVTPDDLLAIPMFRSADQSDDTHVTFSGKIPLKDTSTRVRQFGVADQANTLIYEDLGATLDLEGFAHAEVVFDFRHDGASGTGIRHHS